MKPLVLALLALLALSACAGKEYPCGTGTMTDKYMLSASGPMQSGTFQRKTTIDCRTEKTPAK